MSFVFYGWADWRFLPLLMGNGLVDFCAGLLIERYPKRKRLWLITSLSANLGCLGAFKYLGFLTSSLDAVASALGHGVHVPIIQLALPIGISFYTFQSMSYTIDVYRGHLRPTHSLLHFFASLTIFPHLVAGPIIRASSMLPQLLEFRRTSEPLRWEAMTFIAQGCFMKMIVADNLAPVVNEAFRASILTASLPYWWLIMTMFAMQIYCDFAGYSLIARGLAKWMAVELVDNFKHPYRSLSLAEFWSRWHISLSTWFRDYLFIPLGGSRGSAAATYRNLCITFLVSGLWHGAAWTFVVWGGLHALYLCVERATGWPERLRRVPGGVAVCWILVILQVWVGWVFFRATSFHQAVQVLKALVDVRKLSVAPITELAAVNPRALVALILGVLMELWAIAGLSRIQMPRIAPVRILAPLGVALVLVTCIYWRGPGSAFIYFQF